MSIVLTLMYDGTRYAGWQRQINAVGIQNELEKALGVLYRREVLTIGSGRTDAGVHADEQPVIFEADDNRVPVEKLAGVLNTILPDDIRILSAKTADENFHPRYSARVRLYRYSMSCRRFDRHIFEAGRMRAACQVRQPLDVEKIRRMLEPLKGSHDFSSFSGVHDSSESKVRELFRIDVLREGDYVHVDLWGSGFLQGMVRSIIGTLLNELRNGCEEDILYKKLMLRSHHEGRVRAPACGLTLRRVFYTPIFGPRDYYKEWTK